MTPYAMIKRKHANLLCFVPVKQKQKAENWKNEKNAHQ